MRMLSTELSEESMSPASETIDEKSSARAWTFDLIARPLRPKNEKRKNIIIFAWSKDHSESDPDPDPDLSSVLNFQFNFFIQKLNINLFHIFYSFEYILPKEKPKNALASYCSQSHLVILPYTNHCVYVMVTTSCLGDSLKNTRLRCDKPFL
jgi:hypothetical protein